MARPALPTDYASVAADAASLLRSRSTFTYVLSWLLPSSNRSSFLLWYGYFRWVDDVVDDGGLDRASASAFLDRQTRLVSGEIPARECRTPEEQFAPALLGRHGDDPAFITLLQDMLTAIRSDLERQHADAIRLEDLETSWRTEVQSYLGTIGYFCGVRTSPPPGSSAALGAKWVHILRDAQVDIDAGLRTLAADDLSAHGLDAKTLRNDPACLASRRWVSGKWRRAGRLLQDGSLDAQRVTDWRYRLIVAMLIAKYRCHLDDVERRGFVLGSLRRAGVLHWVGHVLKALRPSVRPQRRDRALVPVPLAVSGAMASAATPILRHVLSAPLRKALRNLDSNPGRRRRRERRFVVAKSLGRAAYAAIVGRESCVEPARTRASEIFAFWSLAVIEFDALVDELTIDETLLARIRATWAASLQSATAGAKLADKWPDHEVASFPPARAGYQRFRRLAAELDTLLRSSAASGPGASMAADPFVEEVNEFLDGQVESRLQRIIPPAKDWTWFSRDLLDKKTMGFFFAPLALWARSEGERAALQRLRASFVELNGAYFHWQILDDIADLRDDAANGIVSSPAYLLLAQARLAAAQEGQNADQDNHAAGVDAALMREDLFYAAALDAVRHKAGDAAGGTRAPILSVANRPTDFERASSDLFALRVEQGARWEIAARSGDVEGWLSSLAESGVVERLLDAASEEGRRSFVTNQLRSIRDQPTLETLAILETLIRRAQRRASDVARSLCPS